jgi:ATP-dependent DNA helicase RecG
MHPHSPITDHFRLNEFQKKALLKLGIRTPFDMLYHFPTRYGNTSDMKNIASLTKGETAVIFGKISDLKMSKGFKSKIPMADGMIEDDTGKIKAVWFNQPYLAKMTAEGALVRVEGKVSERKKTAELYLSNPKIEVVGKLPVGVGDSLFGADKEAHTLYPVYPESRGVTSNWLFHGIQKVFRSGLLDTLVDPIPEEILKKYNLPTLRTALIWIHAPLKNEDAQSARKRFAFEEIFFIQLEKQRARREYQKQKAFVIEPSVESVGQFVSRFPFQSTEAQKKAIDTILADFKKGHAMSRLLEGDVGSGKTAVAATSAYATITSKPVGRQYGHLQVAYMCPTEILASQHFESFIEYFKYLNISVGLITGSGCRKFPSKLNPKGWTDISKAQLLKWVASGDIPILIGTHALIQKSVKFKHLAYVIIDEQHRFGTAQRQKLVTKEGLAPHLLSMTATPIPRTLALTMYGDLDLTLLDQMPHGRKPIITEIVLPDQRTQMYEKIRDELQTGRQVYIICPRINEPDPTKEMALMAKSVKEEAKQLKAKVFPEYEIGVLHSKMNDKDKEQVMLDFKAGKIDILCATSVVEVGVNVPNATVIVIEGAERFGLAQLHQLRGRVIRSNHQAYCFVYAESAGEKTRDRLHALKTAKNGFELAEYDLKFRGAGELSGMKQWGVSDIAMEALQNLKMVEAARTEVNRLLDIDESLAGFPLIKKYLADRSSDKIHFE